MTQKVIPVLLIKTLKLWTLKWLFQWQIWKWAEPRRVDSNPLALAISVYTNHCLEPAVWRGECGHLPRPPKESTCSLCNSRECVYWRTVCGDSEVIFKCFLKLLPEIFWKKHTSNLLILNIHLQSFISLQRRETYLQQSSSYVGNFISFYVFQW